tara:strand:- start:1551 stop:1703 length:153 start_codon:yes stop_codon:yes gene_type:complete
MFTSSLLEKTTCESKNREIRKNKKQQIFLFKLILANRLKSKKNECKNINQ